jgi:FHS family L-fucose permease-like MFS transporter
MAIVGGAVIPAVQGLMSDAVGSMRWSFLVPTIAFELVSYYFATEVKQEMATGR